MVTRELVLRALGWDALQYGNFLFDSGIEYLRRYCGDDEEILSQFSRHQLFWSWFRNHWHIRDYGFIQDTKGLSQAEKLEYYKSLHNMQGFRYKPHRVVMDMAMYAEVIYPATHEEVTV